MLLLIGAIIYVEGDDGLIGSDIAIERELVSTAHVYR